MDAATLMREGPEWDTIGELVRARGRPGSPDARRLAVEVCGRSATYGELDSLSERVAANLAMLGVTKGDRVASFAFNCLEQLLLWFGCAKLGAVWVPLNVSLAGDDLVYAIRDSAPKVLVTDGETCGKIDAAVAADAGLSDLVHRLCIDALPGQRSFAALLGEAAGPPAHAVGRHDPAVIIYTGGTTGLPKGVVLPHFAWIAAGYRYGEAFSIGPLDRHYSVLSLFHVGGLMIGVMGPMMAGIPSFIDRWFSVSNFWSRARETRATVIDPIGTMVTLLCRQAPRADDRDHDVRVAFGVLSQVPADIAEQVVARFGIDVVNVYSLTETGGVLIVHNKPVSGRPKANGKGWGWCEIGILDDQDRLLPAGQTGEIVLRPTIPFTFMLEYHNNPAKTIECFRNLWLHTGDLGHLDDDGCLYLTGRKAHRLRVRGENVSAYEVEDTLSRYPGIQEVIVVGIPSELGDQDIKAFIIVDENAGRGAQLDPAALVTWCMGHMAPYKVPRYIEVVDEFPRSVTKSEVERHKLRDMSNQHAWDAQRVFGRRSLRASAMPD